MGSRIEQLKTEIAPLREQLISHPLYTRIQNLADLQVFMQHHIFAVWDFMSLLKSLQRSLTCTEAPWVPAANPATSYLINEIVTGEETDIDQHGQRMSHFELYRQAMIQAECDTTAIDGLIQELKAGTTLDNALLKCKAPDAAADFVHTTFSTIATGNAAVIAAVFTFGREDLIPGMFISFVRDLNQQTASKAGVFQYYLERHIEVDGDHHSHLAYEMTEQLCGDDEATWAAATEFVKGALSARIQLWNAILSKIEQPVTCA